MIFTCVTAFFRVSARNQRQWDFFCSTCLFSALFLKKSCFKKLIIPSNAKHGFAKKVCYFGKIQASHFLQNNIRPPLILSSFLPIPYLSPAADTQCWKRNRMVGTSTTLHFPLSSFFLSVHFYCIAISFVRHSWTLMMIKKEKEGLRISREKKDLNILI